MNAENMVMLRVHGQDGISPQTLWKEVKPDNCISSKWIPQTMGDQVWLWFELPNIESKSKFEGWLTGYLAEKGYPLSIITRFSQKVVDHWANGDYTRMI